MPALQRYSQQIIRLYMIKKYFKLKPVNALLCALTVAVTVLADFASKRAVMGNMSIGESIPIIGGVFNFTYITNDGAAFGSFSEHRWVFMLLSSVFIVVLTCLLFVWEENRLFYVSASMIIGGGIGNMIDRIAYGTVVDFLDFCAFPSLWKWVFNLADSFVCVGAALLILYYILFEIKNGREEKLREENELVAEITSDERLENSDGDNKEIGDRDSENESLGESPDGHEN